MKPENRESQLKDIADKQNKIIELMTWAIDNFPEADFPGNMLKKYLGNASEELHKIHLLIATGGIKPEKPTP